MTRLFVSAVAAAALPLAACESQVARADDAAKTEVARLPESPASDPVASTQALPEGGNMVAAQPPAGDVAASNHSPRVLTAAAERGEKGARSVLLSFARAIELKRFGEAYDLLSPADKQRWSRADFAAIFDDLGKITVAAPDGSMEGAAGSSYYTAPLTITFSDGDGRPVRITGEAVLRRVNDVPGATPAQLRWHMNKVTLDWTH